MTTPERSDFRDLLLGISPPWLRKRRASELWDVLGLALDGFADTARDAVKARFVNLAPSDALGFIGADRLLERYATQSEDSWRAWIEAAWDLWTFAGTENSVERALAEAGFTGASVHQANGTPPPGWVGAWPPDSDTANWSRFWVWLAEPWPFPWQPVLWGDGHKYGDGHTWGSTATKQEIDLVRRIVRKWAPAHTICPGIYVPFSGGPTLLWKGTP